MLPLLLSLLACKPESTDDTGPIDLGDPADELVIPDVEDIDLEATWSQALQLAIRVNMRPAWRGHVATLDRRVPGCPDVYAGAPDIDGVDVDMDAPGLTWYDHCQNPDESYYSGWAYWETGFSVDGMPDDPGGQTVEASRTLTANAGVGQADQVLFEFDGEGSDFVSRTNDATGYSAWTWNSLVEATVTGTDAFQGDPLLGKGWRTDLNIQARGGANGDSLDVRGNVYLFDGRLSERFDSLAMNLLYTGANAAGPETCVEEPLGYLSLRDENAFWYDLVFLPRFEDDVTDIAYPNDPLQKCDGCGFLYIRGVKQDVQICPDFSSIFSELAPPTAAEFMLSLRDVEEEGQ